MPEGLEIGSSSSIFNIKFEIQIRTAFEHAWIVSTHPLTYKSDNIAWRRVRLAAQIKSATEQLDLSIVQFEQLAMAIGESPWPEMKEKQHVVDLIDRLNRDKVIPSEAGPKDMTRFAENLISVIRASKRKIRLEDALSELNMRLRNFTEESFPRSVSLLQLCMGILCQSRILSGPLQKYSCHVTEQLIQLFPETRSLTPVFRYDKR